MVRFEDADAILSASASFTYGGRYNKRGEFGALYLGDSPDTCQREKLKQVSGQGQLLPPQALGHIEVDIKIGVDLSVEANLKALGLTLREMTDEVDRVLPQNVGEEARRMGIHALLVQSAVAAGKNLVIFEDALTHRDCQIQVVKIEKLSL